MDVSVRGYPVITEGMCLFSKRIYLFGMIMHVPSELMCLFERVAPVTTEKFYKEQITLQKGITQKTKNNNHKNK